MAQLVDFCMEGFAGCSVSLMDAIAASEVPGLGEGSQNPSLQSLLSTQPIGDLIPTVSSSKRLAECESGLWLLAGDIHRSHDISQDLPSAEGSFLHGIMHRREHDFGNAKYWFRKVGNHPVFQQINDEAGETYQDPFDFVDQCSGASASGTVSQCQAAQWIEWQMLMAYILGS